MGRLSQRGRLLTCSAVLFVILAAAQAPTQSRAAGWCGFCVSYCADNPSVHCLGNANCPWPPSGVTCAPNLNCAPGEAWVECSSSTIDPP